MMYPKKTFIKMHQKNITHKLYIAKVQNTMKYMCFIYQMHHKYKPSGQRCPHGSAPSIIIILDALGVNLVCLKALDWGSLSPPEEIILRV